MSYQLIERPHKQVFSCNPVRYVFNISNPNTPGSAMEVALYILNIDEDPNNIGTLVTKQVLTPNPDGKVYFYCEDYLNSQLDWQLPLLANDNVVAVTSQIKRFYIEYRQITRANQSPEWASDQANVRIVLKGGVAKEKFDRNNFFINYLPAKQPFLTWLPDKHFIGLEERRYLTYFHYYDPEILLVPTLRARVVYTDGTQETVEKAFPSLNASKLFHCPAGLKQLGLDDLHPDKMIWYYDVSVYNNDPIAGDSGDLAKPYRMYADYRKFYDVFSFVYHNSISGIDTLRIRGDYDIETILNTTDIQQATGGDFSGEILPTENTTVNVSAYKTFDGDAGMLNTKLMQEALEDLLLSDGVYQELFGRRWLRVMNLAKNQKMGSKEATIWNFPIKWRYTFDNTQFTPFNLDLGDGVMDEAAGPLFGTCTAPGNLAVALTDDQPDHKTYRLSWDAAADALGYDVEVTYPDGSTAVTNDIADTHFDVILTVAGDYSWRVRTRCGVNDYSGYVAGPGMTVLFVAVVCTAPANFNVILLSITGANADVKFVWDAVGGVVGYVIEWREVGSAIWNSATVVGTDYTTTVLKDVQYERRVKSQCNITPEYSGYKYGDNFIASNMVGTCNAPTVLAVALTSSTFLFKSCRFTWTNAAGADDYQVQLRIVGATTWIIADNKQSGYTVIFPNGYELEWRVRSNCTGGGFSNFANGDNFNT